MRKLFTICKAFWIQDNQLLLFKRTSSTIIFQSHVSTQQIINIIKIKDFSCATDILYSRTVSQLCIYHKAKDLQQQQREHQFHHHCQSINTYLNQEIAQTHFFVLILSQRRELQWIAHQSILRNGIVFKSMAFMGYKFSKMIYKTNDNALGLKL